MVDGGADVNQVDQWRQTLLFVAKKSRNADVVKLLQKHGATVMPPPGRQAAAATP